MELIILYLPLFNSYLFFLFITNQSWFPCGMSQNASLVPLITEPIIVNVFSVLIHKMEIRCVTGFWTEPVVQPVVSSKVFNSLINLSKGDIGVLLHLFSFLSFIVVVNDFKHL